MIQILSSLLLIRMVTVHHVEIFLSLTASMKSLKANYSKGRNFFFKMLVEIGKSFQRELNICTTAPVCEIILRLKRLLEVSFSSCDPLLPCASFLEIFCLFLLRGFSAIRGLLITAFFWSLRTEHGCVMD